MQNNFSLFSKKILWLQAGVALFVFLLCYMFGNLRVETNKEVAIPNGANLNTIASILKEEKIVRTAIGFKILAYAKGQQNNLKAGDYRFGGFVASHQVLDNIFTGRTIEEVFTMIEGWTVKQALRSMQQSPHLSGKVSSLPREGSLLPNSYSYRRGTDRQEIIDKMQKAMTVAVDTAWDNRTPVVDKYIKNKKEFIIFASMIERETAIKGEKTRVAGVFINRLKKGMRLETDPTVIYGLSNRLGELNRKLYIKDLRKPHPWNTYVIYGMPRTAIANPSRETLLAAANPEKNNYFYFVANGRGGHEFATNFADHKKNVKKYITNRKK